MEQKGSSILAKRLFGLGSTDPITGVLSPECEKAIARWFSRVER